MMKQTYLVLAIPHICHIEWHVVCLKLLYRVWGGGTLRFRPGPLLFKNIQFFVLLFRPGQIEKTLVLKKICVSLLFLSPKSPVFPVSGRSESPPFSVRGRFLSPPPPFLPCAAHIYQFHI